MVALDAALLQKIVDHLVKHTLSQQPQIPCCLEYLLRLPILLETPRPILPRN